MAMVGRGHCTRVGCGDYQWCRSLYGKAITTVSLRTWRGGVKVNVDVACLRSLLATRLPLRDDARPLAKAGQPH